MNVKNIIARSYTKKSKCMRVVNSYRYQFNKEMIGYFQ